MLDAVKTGVAMVIMAGFVGGCGEEASAGNTSRAPEDIRKSYSFGYWVNGWRKAAEDTSPDTLAYETGYYGLVLDMDQLSSPRFGLFDDDLDYEGALEAGVERLASLEPASLTLEAEVNGTVYQAVSCRSGTEQEMNRLASTRLWESGRVHQHFDVQDLTFQDEAGNRLGCYGNLHLYGWPRSLTLKLELAPDELYVDGPAMGVSGGGQCIIEKPLDIPHRPALEPEQLTVECWVKFPEKVSTDGFGWLVCKNENEWEEGNYGLMFRGASVVAYMNIGGGPDNVVSIGSGVMIGHQKGEWHHLALTYDGTTMRSYLNGHEQGSEIIGKARVPGKGLLRIGQRADGKFDTIKGVYDQVRIWKRALSRDELAAHARKPKVVPSRDGLAFERAFDDQGEVKEPAWTDAKLRVAFKAGELAWQDEKQVPGTWKIGEQHSLTLTCGLPDEPAADEGIAIRVSTPDGQKFPVAFAEDTNCRKVLIESVERNVKWKPHADGGLGNHYDEFIIEVENRAEAAERVPFQLHMINVPAITGLVPLLCEEDGTPTGIPVQLSKNWHYKGAYLHAYTFLPAQPGTTRYRFRIIYGIYGTLPSASHGQLSLVGWGGNARWDQLAIGSWGETFCLDLDMSNTDVSITDVRALFIRNGKDGQEWNWSDGGWGGDWLGILNAAGEKLAFSRLKTAYLAHGPCLTDVRYMGGYGPDGLVDLEAGVRTLRADDYARTFNTLRYRFDGEFDTEGSWFYKMGGGWYTTPKIAYGNREGLIAEHRVPQTLRAGDTLMDPVTLEGEGPWWVAYPGAYTGDQREWGTGSRALVIRGYKASFGGREVANPTIAFPVNTRTKLDDRTDINLLLVPPTDVKAFQPGDVVELDVEWIVLPREADDYYGPNEAFRKHMAKHPRSWKTVHREAVGNDLGLKVEGGAVKHRYPILIEASEPEVRVEIAGGIGFVPIRFDGLKTADGYALYEILEDGSEKKLDQALRGNDDRQIDLDTGTGTYRIAFNLPLDGKETSRWVLKR